MEFLAGLFENLNSILIYLNNALIDYIINPAIVSFCGLVSVCVEIMPDAPDWASVEPLRDTTGWSTLLHHLNWLLPLDALIQAVFIYHSSAFLFMTCGPLLRWLKLIK